MSFIVPRSKRDIKLRKYKKPVDDTYTFYDNTFFNEIDNYDDYGSDEEVIELSPEKKKEWDIFNVDGETSDKDLEKWGNKYIPGFVGVVARDDYGRLYPNKLIPGTSCIINLDYGDYARGGTHWCAVRVSSESPKLLYFDAFGIPPPKNVTLRGYRDGRGVVYSDIQYQGIDQTNCGQRSLAVLYELAKAAKEGKELETFNMIGLED